MTIKDLRIVLVLFFGLIVSISTSTSVSNASTSFDGSIELDAENQDSSPEEEEFLARSHSKEESQEKGNLFAYCYKNPVYCTAIVVSAVALVGVSLVGSNYLNGNSSDNSSTTSDGGVANNTNISTTTTNTTASTSTSSPDAAKDSVVPAPGQEDYDAFRANIKETQAAKGKAFEALSGDTSLQYLKDFNVPNPNVNPMNRLFTGKHRIRGMSLTTEGNLSIITKFAGANREQIFTRP